METEPTHIYDALPYDYRLWLEQVDMVMSNGDAQILHLLDYTDRLEEESADTERDIRELAAYIGLAGYVQSVPHAALMMSQPLFARQYQRIMQLEDSEDKETQYSNLQHEMQQFGERFYESQLRPHNGNNIANLMNDLSALHRELEHVRPYDTSLFPHLPANDTHELSYAEIEARRNPNPDRFIGWLHENRRLVAELRTKVEEFSSHFELAAHRTAQGCVTEDDLQLNDPAAAHTLETCKYLVGIYEHCLGLATKIEHDVTRHYEKGGVGSP